MDRAPFPARKGHYLRLLRSVTVASVISFMSALTTGSATEKNVEVWFDPAPFSADYVDLFRHPDTWANARRATDAFFFSPDILSQNAGLNSLDRLFQVRAFEKLRDWKIKTGIDGGAIKEWDCLGSKNAEIQSRRIMDIHDHGGLVDFVAMDEPLIAGLGRHRHICNLTLTETADRTVLFTKSLIEKLQYRNMDYLPRFVETEPYPSLNLQTHEEWIDALLNRGFRPAGYNLDIALAQIDNHPELARRFPQDLRELQTFLGQRHIPLGIIIWSSHDPVESDQAYYDFSMDMTRRIKRILGVPHRVVFASWVKRGCGAGLECGETVPSNLPDDNDMVFSHTKLMLDSLKVLSAE